MGGWIWSMRYQESSLAGEVVGPKVVFTCMSRLYFWVFIICISIVRESRCCLLRQWTGCDRIFTSSTPLQEIVVGLRCCRML